MFLRNLRRVGARNFSASPTPPSPIPTPPPRRKWFSARNVLIGTVGLGGSIYVFDLVVNDELENLWRWTRPKLSEEERKNRPKLLILGSGWGALSLVRKIHADKFNITVVSPRNFFLFTPLLPSTTCGTIEPRSIMEPIHYFCKRSEAENVKFIEAECTEIDHVNQKIKCADKTPIQGNVKEFDLDYDYLVVGVGMRPATYNIPGVEEHAYFMKEVEHANTLRNRIIDTFETALIPGQPESEIQRLLHFVVVGGGPTGVELAAELHDFLISDLKKAFPDVADKVRITLIEAMPHILAMFDPALVEYTEKKFGREEINLLTKSLVVGVEDREMSIKDTTNGSVKKMPYGLLVWASGVTTNPLVRTLMNSIGGVQPMSRALVVDDHLRVKGANRMFALGDCAFIGLPPTAQVASQQGRYLGRLLNQVADAAHESVQEKKLETVNEAIEKIDGFTYGHQGSFAYIGTHSAIADFRVKGAAADSKKGFVSEGFATFVLWRSVYLSKLLSARNRFCVAADWTKTLLFGRDTSRG